LRNQLADGVTIAAAGWGYAQQQVAWQGVLGIQTMAAMGGSSQWPSQREESGKRRCWDQQLCASCEGARADSSWSAAIRTALLASDSRNKNAFPGLEQATHVPKSQCMSSKCVNYKKGYQWKGGLEPCRCELQKDCQSLRRESVEKQVAGK
jgi:hypothetical protein